MSIVYGCITSNVVFVKVVIRFVRLSQHNGCKYNPTSCQYMVSLGQPMVNLGQNKVILPKK
jgi:hypothetical protein